jgi:hypothetical protein
MFLSWLNDVLTTDRPIYVRPQHAGHGQAAGQHCGATHARIEPNPT